MLGTLVNAGAVLTGSAVGLGIGPRLSQHMKLILMLFDTLGYSP